VEQEEHYRTNNLPADNGGLWEKGKMAGNNAKIVRDLDHSRGGPGLARDVRRVGANAQERVNTDTHMAAATGATAH
jgi:hypothetical protein